MQAELQEKRLALARQEAARSEELAARGLLALRDRDARRANALAAEQDMAIQRRLISSTERDISDVSARMSAITLEKVTAAAENRAAEASLEQRMNEAEARTALARFAQMDQRDSLLGRGFARIDMRDPRRAYVRISREPGARVPDATQTAPDPGQPPHDLSETI